MESDWSNLPTHLLVSVFGRLSPSDHLRFKCACSAWNVAKDRQKLSAILTTHPMLLISDQRKDTWNVYDIVNDEVLKLQLRLSSKRFCGSSKGWLIAVDENFRVTLINPLSKVKGRRERENSTIRLPPLNPPGELLWAKHSDYSVLKATISGDPIFNANDCVVVIIYEPLCRLAFIRLNQDKEWTYVVQSGVRYNGFIFYEDVAPIEGKIYAVTGRSELLAFAYTENAILNANVAAWGFETEGIFEKIYLVGSSEEELLMVHRIIGYEEDGRHEDMVKRVTKGFRIYGLDSANKKWIEKDNLGDVALFVGENTSISVVASSVSGCEPNSIYFYHDHDRIRKHYVFQDFGVYDVGSGRIKKPALAKTLLIKAKQPPIWLLPTLSM